MTAAELSAIRAGMTTVTSSLETPESLATYLVEQIERAERGFKYGADARRDEALAVWAAPPAVLVELWGWCGAAGAPRCPLFSMGRPLVSPFPSDEAVLSFSGMSFLSPGDIREWVDEAKSFEELPEECPDLFEWLKQYYPSHHPFAYTDRHHLLCVGEGGRVSAWLNPEGGPIDVPTLEEDREVYASFDGWMRDTAAMLRSGELRVMGGPGQPSQLVYREAYLLDWNDPVNGWQPSAR